MTGAPYRQFVCSTRSNFRGIGPSTATATYTCAENQLGNPHSHSAQRVGFRQQPGFSSSISDCRNCGRIGYGKVMDEFRNVESRVLGAELGGELFRSLYFTQLRMRHREKHKRGWRISRRSLQCLDGLAVITTHVLGTTER